MHNKSFIATVSTDGTMVNGTLLNFGKIYEDDFRVIFDQWQKFHLGLDALSNQKILKGIYCTWPTIFQDLPPPL